MRELRTITVAEILEGDEYVNEETGFCYWTAQGRVYRDEDGNVLVPVAYADGGRSVRGWQDPNESITIVRDWPEEDVQL